jgi:PAS domain S-box-containing protein
MPAQPAWQAIGLAENNTILICNAAFARSLGRTVDELTGKPVFGLYAPETLSVVRSAVAAADRVGSMRFTTQMLRADGSRFPVQMDVVSVRDERGKVIYRIATQQDLTEIDRADKAFARKEDQLQMAVSAAGMGAWEIDLITNKVIWSTEYAGLLG